MRRSEPVLRSYDVAVYDNAVNGLLDRGVPPIVLMGSSRAKYGLVPEEFQLATGKSAYNIAIAGSKVVEWQLLARRLFAKSKPQLVILGINASELRADYLPTTAARHLFSFDDLLDHLRRDSPSAAVVGNYLQHRLGPLWAAFERRYEVKLWCEERLASLLPKHAQAAREVRRRVAQPCPPDGYDHPWQSGRQLRSLADRLTNDPAEVITASTPKFSARADAFTRLGGLLDWFRGRRIQLLVVYIPNSPATEQRWQAVEPQMVEAIARVCHDHGVPFLRCSSEDVPRSNRDYLEEIHVGLPLARRISRRAAGQVLALGLLDGGEPKLAGTGEADAAP